MGSANADLASLRAEIDDTDAAMHALLMRRAEVIERLIEAKGTAASGQAFRPAREAAMMRALAARHRGLLPLDAAEGIWRVIVATFTHLQAPFAVHGDAGAGQDPARDGPMRDSARFHFGFTAPYAPARDAAAVIAAVAASRGDLGALRLDQGAGAGPWWRGLEAPAAPKVIARLPFIERPDHPAGLPVLVVAKPLEPDAASREVVLTSLRAERWRPALPDLLAARGAEALASAADEAGPALLVAHPDGALDDLAPAMAAAGLGAARLAEVGGHARRFSLGSASEGAG